MLLINYTAMATSPYVLFTTCVNPFSIPAVRIDSVTDPSGTVIQQFAEIAYPFG